MNILMLSYAIIPAFADAFQLDQHTNGAGWIVGMHNVLVKHGNRVALVSPSNKGDYLDVKDGQCSYYTFPKEKDEIIKTSRNREKYFSKVLREINPDIVVVFGTEFSQSLDMLRACEKENLIDQTVIFIQGLLSMIKRYYAADLPLSIIKHKTLSERLSHMDISSQVKLFDDRSKNEVEILKTAKHVIGGTVWDKNVIYSLNPNIEYHYCPEILRDSFYSQSGSWSLKNCEKHAILSVQSNFYPLKGLHYLLEGFKLVHDKYPESVLYITIKKPRDSKRIINRIKGHTYETYIDQMLDKLDIRDSVRFVGNVAEKELVEYYLHCNAFVCSSSIENHSQTVSEAKILGVPTVASFVGGVVERITHGQDGFLYQHNAPYMIAEYIGRLFDDDELAIRISKEASKNASILVDRNRNLNILCKLFEQIAGV